MKYKENQLKNLIQQRKGLGENDLNQSHELKLQIFELLKKQFHTDTDKSFLHHKFFHEQKRTSSSMKSLLYDQGVRVPLRSLRDDKRKEEITDTSLVSYLELLFGNDTLEYTSRKRDNETISSTQEYLEQQENIIMSLDFNIGQLTDNELKNVFSLCTDHVYNATIPMIRYRHQAVQYVPQLKEVLSTAVPYKLNENELSYKIITLTQGPGAGKIIEFSFRSPLDEHRHENRIVLINIYNSITHHHEKLIASLDALRQKISELENIKIRFQQRYNAHIEEKNKTIRQDKIEALQQELDKYHNLHIDRISARIDKAIDHNQYMHIPHYMMTMGAMLRDLDLAIRDQTAKFNRLGQYAKGKNN